MRSFAVAFTLSALAALSIAAPAAVPAQGTVEKRDYCWDENFNYGWWTGHAECSGNPQDLWQRPLFGKCAWDQGTVDYGTSVGRTAC